MTTVHAATDARISEKEAAALAAAGYEVAIVAPANGASTASGVRVHPIRPARSRVERFALSGLRALRAAVAEHAQIYHLHDPELLPVGLALRILGKTVVYDAHEDLPKQILSKPWLPRRIRPAVSRVADVVERAASRGLSSVVGATPTVAARFGNRAISVMNYPVVGRFTGSEVPYQSRPPNVVYVGGLTLDRGLRTMVDALGDVRQARLVLAGRFQPSVLENQLRTWPNADRVDYVGWKSRDEVAALLASSRAGVVVLQPLPRYVEAYPVKLFEYMAAGIPVIAADYPLWRQIVLGAECGLVVQPEAPALAKAINWLLLNPKEAEAMGRRGAEAAARQYSWPSEARKLVDLYDRLEASRSHLPTHQQG